MYKALQNIKEKQVAYLMIGVETIIVLIAYAKYLFAPSKFLFNNNYDAIRQYYYFHQLCMPNANTLCNNNMGYPYGEYIYYTDCTPLLASIVRIFSRYIYDISGYSFGIFHYFFALGIVLSAFICFKILRLLNISLLIAFVFSITLPWIAPEFVKHLQGQFNLSMSWPFLTTIYMLIRIYEHKTDNKKLLKYTAFLVLFITIISFLHLYWLMLCEAIIGFFLLFLIIYETFTQKKLPIPLLLHSIAIILIPFIISIGIIRLTDGYYQERALANSGYGWGEWTMQFCGLYTAPTYYTFKYFIGCNQLDFVLSSQFYLGNFALYGFTILILVKYFQPTYFISIHALQNQHKKIYLSLALLSLAAFFSFMISLGEKIYFAENKYVIHNYLNIFVYIHRLTDKITQFRDVLRFGFVFFWAVHFVLIYLLHLYVQSYYKKPIFYLIVSLLSLLLLSDTRDRVRFNRKMYADNLLVNKEKSSIDELIKGIDLSQYQAFIPLPVQYEGAANVAYIIDADDDFQTNIYQLSLWGNLPCMSAKFARGTDNHALQYLSLFPKDSIEIPQVSPLLLNRLNEKPILILCNEDYFNDKRPFHQHNESPAKDILKNCGRFFELYKPQKIKEYESYSLYHLELKQLKTH